MTPGLNPRIGYGTPEYEAGLPSNEEEIRLHTRQVYEKLWFENIADNMPLIRSGLNLGDYPQQKGRSGLVIAGGPSVEKYKQLEVIAAHSAYKEKKFFIIACDKMLKPCVATGVIPQLVATMDATPEIIKFFTGMSRLSETAIAPSIISNPKAVLAASIVGPLYWWMPIWDDYRQEKSYTRTNFWMSNKVMIQALGNIGATSIFIELALGCEPIAFIGFDLGYPPETPLTKDQYYKGYLHLVKVENAKRDEANKKVMVAYQKALKSHKRALAQLQKEGKPTDPSIYVPPQIPAMFSHITIEDCYRYIINSDTNRHILVGLNWDVYRNIFLKFWSASQLRPEPDAKRTLINLSPESSVFEAGIKTADLKQWLDGMVK